MIFRTFGDAVEINGQIIPCHVKIVVDEDDGMGDEIAEYGDCAPEYRERFNNGDLFLGVVIVEAHALGEEGYDALGACHIHCNNMYSSEAFNKDVAEIVEVHHMVEAAKEELVLELQNKLTLFKNNGLVK